MDYDVILSIISYDVVIVKLYIDSCQTILYTKCVTLDLLLKSENECIYIYGSRLDWRGCHRNR
jgi:hypothetical protein